MRTLVLTIAIILITFLSKAQTNKTGWQMDRIAPSVGLHFIEGRSNANPHFGLTYGTVNGFTLKTSYNTVSRYANARPSDYKGEKKPYDFFRSTDIMVGYRAFLGDKQNFSFTMNGGVGFVTTTKAKNFVAIEEESLYTGYIPVDLIILAVDIADGVDENYEFDYVKERKLGILINPELGIRTGHPLSLFVSPYINLNKSITVSSFHLNLTYNFLK